MNIKMKNKLSWNHNYSFFFATQAANFERSKIQQLLNTPLKITRSSENQISQHKKDKFYLSLLQGVNTVKTIFYERNHIGNGGCYIRSMLNC